MKKVIAILIAGLFLTMFIPAGLSQAGTVKAEKKSSNGTEVVKGKVVSIDAAHGKVVIKDEVSGTDKTISVDPKTIVSLQVGEKVKARLTAGTNNAVSVKEQKKTYESKK